MPFTKNLWAGRFYLLVVLTSLFQGCGGGGGDNSNTPPVASPSSSPDSAVSDSSSLSDMAQVGKLLFYDKTLSVSGQQSCGTCHVPSRAYAADDGRAVPLGGPNMELPGLRNAPSLVYTAYTPPFHIESDGTAVGGFFRDGRAPTLAVQAEDPFTTPFEMANPNAEAVRQRLLGRPYLSQFKAVFGADAVNDADTVMTDIGQAIAAYEREDISFHPFTSKYDYWKKGLTKFTPKELEGYRLFIDPSKGNCAACHVATGSNGTPALFTDFTYDNVGIPRNWRIPANDNATALSYVPDNGVGLGAPDYRYYDLGLCGPLRTDKAGVIPRCGQFKVPTLRNIALTAPYFHNGVFKTLQEVVSWYITRDTDPERWYKKADGSPDVAYNDLPMVYDPYVNIDEVPYNPDLAPTLTSPEMSALITFLCTLTDGYDPADPGAYRYPPQCQLAASSQ